MNITVLANRDLPSNYALNLLLPKLRPQHAVTVFLSGQVGKAKPTLPELAELKFFEQTLFNELLFPATDASVADVSAAVDRPEPGGDRLLSFQDLGRWLGRPIEILNRINRPASLKRLHASAPDLVLSIRYGSILRDAAIAVPRHGVLNLHSGLLPAYRGVMATFWALRAGETTLGTTLHTIEDAGIDTGSILDQTTLAVDPERSYLWHVLHLYPEGVARMVAAVERLERGEALTPQPQGADGAYFTFPTAEEMATFRATGHRLVDVDELTDFARRYLPRETHDG